MVASQRQTLFDRRMAVYVPVVTHALLGKQPGVGFIGETEVIEGLTQQSVDALAGSVVKHQARGIASQLRQSAIKHAQAADHSPLAGSWPQAGYWSGLACGFMGVPLPLRITPGPGGHRATEDAPLSWRDEPAQMSQHSRVIPAQQRSTTLWDGDRQLPGQMQSQSTRIGLRSQQHGKKRVIVNPIPDIGTDK